MLVLLARWVERRVLPCCWHDLQGLELPFILGRGFPVAAEVQHSAALVQSPQETLRSLTRPDVEVKFSSTMTYNVSIKGEGKT